jgi:signal transduction histidine kinase
VRDAANTWERRIEVAIPAIPFVMLAVSAFGATVVEDRSAPGPTLAISAVALVWLLLRCKLPPAVFVAGLLALATVLSIRSPIYGFFVFSGYLALDALPGWWKAPPLVITAVLAGLSQSGGVPIEAPGVFALLAVVNLFVAGSLFGFSLLGEERARRRQEMERDAGVLQERQRLAREIHDTLAQGLTGIVAQLEAAAQARKSGTDDTGYLEAAAELARENLEEARRSVRALGPGELEGARLPDALAQVTGSWAARTNVPVAFTTTGEARSLHPEVEVALLRAAQEALANVAKHAGATRVGLTLSYMEDLVTLDVRDDGVGFEHTRGGFGLTGMLQRVRSVGGELAVESRLGEGTAISASVPAVPA